MKGKKILALASIFASVALVGSTFALWAVTDNADPFSMKISPGDISTDQDVKRVTLSYGDKTYANVGNIQNGTKRLAATVALQAQWEKDANHQSFAGLLNVKLETSNTGSLKLIDYLKVYATTTNPNAVDGLVTGSVTGDIGTITPLTTNYTDNFAVELNNPNDSGLATKTVYIVVEYLTQSTPVSGDPVPLTAQNIQALASDEVTLTLDWNKPATGVENAYTVYYSGNLNDVCVYAWTSDNKEVNGAYPGVPMTLVRPGLYSYELPAKYYGFLLVRDNNPVKDDCTKVTSNDVIINDWYESHYNTGSNPKTNCYVGGENPWSTVPVEVTYYVVGSFNMVGDGWKLGDDTYKMTPSDSHYVLSNLVLSSANTEIKIYGSDNTWYGVASTYDNCGYELGDGAENAKNAKIAAAGTYTITFYPDGSNYNYIRVDK